MRPGGVEEIGLILWGQSRAIDSSWEPWDSGNTNLARASKVLCSRIESYGLYWF